MRRYHALAVISTDTMPWQTVLWLIFFSLSSSYLLSSRPKGRCANAEQNKTSSSTRRSKNPVRFRASGSRVIKKAVGRHPANVTTLGRFKQEMATLEWICPLDTPYFDSNWIFSPKQIDLLADPNWILFATFSQRRANPKSKHQASKSTVSAVPLLHSLPSSFFASTDPT